MQFIAYDKDSTWVASIETKDDMLSSYKYHRSERKSTVYHFNTTLNYEKFIYYFTEACVRFIKNNTIIHEQKNNKNHYKIGDII